MKIRTQKFILIRGISLLEVMLALTVAATILITSMRYYKAATASQQSSATLAMIQLITAAADSLAQGGTGYEAATQLSIQNITNNGEALTSPWGDSITIDNQSHTQYKVSISKAIGAVCSNIVTQLTANPRYTNILPASCVAKGNTISYVYDSTK
jgi:type II secretory pathway pseudopilin PulG